MDGFREGGQNRSVFDVKRVSGISVVAPHPKLSLVVRRQGC
jgi:hypothetical protein